MRHRPILLLAIILLCTTSLCAGEQPPVAGSGTTPSVVAVAAFGADNSPKASASGFFVEGGYVAVSRHTLLEADTATVSTRDGAAYHVTGIAAEDRKSDVALVTINASAPALAPLILSTDSVAVKDRLTVIGPGGKDTREIGCSVSQTHTVAGFGDVFVVDADLDAQWSGCPVVDGAGRLVGIVRAEALEEADVAIVVPAGRPRGLVPEEAVPLPQWRGALTEANAAFGAHCTFKLLFALVRATPAV